MNERVKIVTIDPLALRLAEAATGSGLARRVAAVTPASPAARGVVGVGGLWERVFGSGGGGGGTYDPSSELIFAGFTTPPTTDRKALIDQAVRALKAAGVWNKLDALYLFAAADSQAAKVNWVQPGTYNCTEVSAPAFATDVGFTGNGTSSYLDTNFNISSAAGRKFAQNDAMIAGWSLTNIDVNAGVVGTSFQDTCILPRLTNLAYGYINDLFGNWPNLDGTGFYCLTRRSATAKELYRNGVSIGTSAQSSSAVVNSTLRFLRYSTGHWAGQCAAGAVGSQLSAVEQAALYNALANYMAGLTAIMVSESVAIFNAMTAPPTVARRRAINTTINALKAGAVWDELDCMYMMAAADSQAAKIHWKSPGTFNLAEVNVPTFTADKGFQGSANGVSHLTAGWSPGANGVKFTQNSASIHYWSQFQYINNGTYDFGGGGGTYGNFSALGNVSEHGLNSSAGAVSFSPPSTIGMFSLSRESAAGYTVSYNGVLGGTRSNAPMVPTSVNFRICGESGGGGSVRQLGFAAWGAGLSATKLTVLNDAVAGYMANLATDAIVAAFTTPPTAARRALIQSTVAALMRGGVWGKLDTLYLFAAADSQAAKINWVKPGTYNAVESGAPTFTADQGFTGAASKYLDSGFNATSSPSPKWLTNDACAFAWENTNLQGTAVLVGDAVDGVTVLPRHTTDVYSARINSTGSPVTGASTDSRGFWAINRTGASAQQVFKNGTGLATNTIASTGTPGAIWFLRSSSAYWLGQIAAGGFGSQLSATEHLALYNALANYQLGLTGVTLEAETVTIINAMTVPPTLDRRRRINDCVLALKNGGVWAKLDALYLFAAADSQAAKVNWKTPGTYNATEVAAPTFTADQGFTGAASKWLDTGFNPTTAPSPNLVQNSATLFGWGNTDGQLTGGLFGNSAGASNNYIILPRDTSNTFLAGVHGGIIIVANANGVGFYVASRTASNLITSYKNGVSVGTDVSASGAPSSLTLAFIHRYSTFWLGQIAAGGFGAGLTAPEQSVLYEALLAYQTGIATDNIAASFTTPPTAARKSLIQTCVGALMRAGVWSKLDALYLFAAADSQAANVNWVKPGTFTAVALNSPVFTADQGYTGNGTTTAVDTQFAPNAPPAGIKYTLNDACTFAWAGTNVVSQQIVGAGGDYIALYPRYTGDFAHSHISQNTVNVTQAGVTDGRGLIAGQRTGVTAEAMFRNGASAGTGTTASTQIGVSMVFLRGNTTFSTVQVMAGGFGSQLSAAEQLALYNALNAYIASTRIFAAFSTPPTEARRTLIQNVVSSLITAGIWDKLDALYMFAAADSQAAKVNWKNPGTYTATEVLAPTFTADRGFTGNATSAYIDSGFDLATAGINYLASFHTFFGYSRSSGVFTRAMVSALGSQPVIAPRVAGDIAEYRSGNTLTASSTPSTDGKGFWSVYRSASNRIDLFKDGVAIAGGANTSSAIVAGNLTALRYGAQYWGGEVACLGVGGPVDAAGQAALSNAITAYLTGVGAAP